MEALSNQETRLHICNDYGSGMLKVAVQLIRDGYTSQTAVPNCVEMDEFCGYGIPQRVAIIDNKAIMGEELAVKVANHETAEEDVFELWKLCLCPEYQNSPAAQRVEEQLEKENHRTSRPDLYAPHGDQKQDT